MRYRKQHLIVFFGILSLIVVVRQILAKPTMILPSWFLLVISLPVLLCISFSLGYLVKRIMDSKWWTITFASIFVMVFCGIYYLSEYRPTYRVIVPKAYVGEIRLLFSNEERSDFFINKYGIGYIDKKTFDEGFYPKIIKDDNDITEQVKVYSKGAIATTRDDVYSYEYLSFSIPAKVVSLEEKDIEELMKIRAIDTSRLYRR